MLKWCAYCQQFQGEVDPFKDLRLTHGMCPGCAAKGLEHTDQEFEHARKLKTLQEALMKAGAHRNILSATNAISDSVKAGIRPLDLLMGLISPMLYEVGESWENGATSVAEEHRFTAFCEEILECVESLPEVGAQAQDRSKSSKTLIVNAYGNRHSLAIRILSLWLRGKGVEARVLWPTPLPQVLAQKCRDSKIQILMISVALAEHRTAAAEISDYFAKQPSQDRPRIIVGGYAVKCGLVSSIPGTELLSDISLFSAFPR